MESAVGHAIAIVGVGATLPDAPNASTFWNNIKAGRYSITEVTPDRWDPARYYDADPLAPDKTYSKIGGWVREHVWDPIKWKLPIPPRVADAMDEGQKWAIACTREALVDFGYPERHLDLDRTAVILGNAMAGEKHYFTALRIYFPEFAHELEESASFAALPESVRRDIERDVHDRMSRRLPAVTEDSMPGELANCIAGRIANAFNLRGPNYVVDAACASAMAAITSAVDGLIQHDFDAVITGGIDRNMGAPSFVKFCKIGALSATGTRPYADGADGFVMGEGAGVFLLKRLADAERDHDKVYAVILGVGGSSDGKGKGITAPNPIGQRLSIERGWHNAGVSPATATLIEGHGTSTRVGDVVEAESLAHVLNEAGTAPQSTALGSVKSNLGHLKSAAGGAGVLKTALALHHKVLPPSIRCEHPNPGIDFAHSPLYVNTELREWLTKGDTPRRAGVSAFGFGGTNFHVVMEEYMPGMFDAKTTVSVPATISVPATTVPHPGNGSAGSASATVKPPLRGALVIGGVTAAEIIDKLRAVQKDAAAGRAPAPQVPDDDSLRSPERIAIDYGNAAELADKADRALKAFTANQPAMWKALRAQGIFRGHGPAPKVAFLYTGQGSQYVNMMQSLRASEPLVAETFAEADRELTSLLGKPLSKFIFVDSKDEAAIATAEDDLRQTAITQPAVLATDISLTRLFAAYGIRPDMTMGHSLGEYGALVASGALLFNEALEAVSARGREMTRVSMADNGKMAAVFAPMEEVERILKAVTGYVVIANINSTHQSVIGGASSAVEQAIEIFVRSGYNAVPLPVSHAFHTSIVAPASEPLRTMLQRLHLQSPVIPIVANLNGEFYPTGPNVVPTMVDILAQQIAAPVQFVKGLRTLYQAGARVFVEVGPKKALQGFADDVLGADAEVLSLFSNHPKLTDETAFNQALCGLYAAGLGIRAEQRDQPTEAIPTSSKPQPAPVTTQRNPVVITGAALGLPGTPHIFDDDNVARILRGEQFIDAIPARFRRAMLDKNITRLVKSENGGPTFETISNLSDVIKLAGRGGEFDLEKEFGVPAERIAALDRVTQLAIAAGIDALRDAGIPLVMRYKTTTKGTQLPDRWGLPDALRDDTAVIFASAFPGYDAFADEMSRYYADHARREQLESLKALAARADDANGNSSTIVAEINRRIDGLQAAIEKDPYVFDRRFLFHVLAMGHSQFAEYIGARGPNTQINSACASTAQAVALAEDWIRAGRCRRVIVISGDDATSDHLIEWIGAGFLASGAAATDEVVEEAAIPFDKRRHGLIVGMGAAAMIVESAEAARERGLLPICEVLSSVTANSAFHGSRLDVQHIGSIMEEVIAQAEQRHGIDRRQIAPEMVFVSHETYTPARGGSASAEICALRRVFGDAADHIVIANTKGFTGHAMATGIEDVVAVKVLETSCVPPVPNFKEVDPELGVLNLSKGGVYPVKYALRLGAGFGSQISMTLMRWVPTHSAGHPKINELGYAYRVADQSAWNAWLARVAGQDAPELEVINRTLRVHDVKATARTTDTTRASHSLAQAAAAAASASVSAPIAPPTKPETTAAALQPVPLAAPASVKTQADSVHTSPKQRSEIGNQKSPIPPPASDQDSVKQRLLTLVSEKTGYPIDMLDVELDLEADLGVDTVKQAEVFAAIREDYNIPRDPNLKLRDFPILAHVIRFVMERKAAVPATVADTAATPAPVVPPQTDTSTAPAAAAPQPVTPPVVAAQPTTPLQPVPTPAATDDVKPRILALVVEKTGYPEDMLDLDLDLEADLGVDTVKQAEMFAAIRQIWNIPRDPNLKLRDFPTLAHVIRFVHDSRPDLAAQSATSATVTPAAPVVSAPPVAVATSQATAPPQTTAAPIATPQPQTSTRAPDDVKPRILALVVEKTDYPEDMLDLDLDLEADLGVDTVKQAEMFAAIRQIWNIPRDPNLKLRDLPTLAHVIRIVHERRPDLASVPPPVTAQTAPAPPAPAPVPSHSEPAPAPPAASPTLAAASASALPDYDSIKETVLSIAADKTGYPKDMLDLDLDLEADLGIDTVKQAEMFAAIRGAYNIPRDTALKLRDFPTLAHVIKFAQERVPAPSAAASAPTTVSANAPAPPTTSPQPTLPVRNLASFDAANAVPRRVPVPVLRPPVSMCKPTGVTLAAGTRVVIMSDTDGVGPALTQQLRDRSVEVLLLDPTLAPDTISARLAEFITVGPVHGLYWLPALDVEEDLPRMNTESWHQDVRVRVKVLYSCTRTLYEQLSATDRFLISATRLGGLHGYDAAGAVAPLGGAVTGFTKAFKRERADATVKAVDFTVAASPDEVAAALIAETLYDTGAVEIGYNNDLRWTIGVEEQPAIDGHTGLALGPASVFVVTGAAGSIVSAIISDLASASGGIFYLLDLAPEPDPHNQDLARFKTDRDGLKRDIFACIQSRGERATPALVEKELGVLERLCAAQTAIDAVRTAGGTAHYFTLDLRDGAAVNAVIDRVRREHGHIDVVLHAAGLERSHFLPDKPASEFDLVFDVKANGFFHLLHSIADMPVGATVVFSSVAGRFGNGGQTDYSAANDLLCKITSHLRSTKPETRAIAIDWTAWGGIGMATRGSIPKMMEAAGIDMLPPEAGIPLIRRELTVGGTRGEIVVAKRLGIMLDEFDSTGGLDPHAVAANSPIRRPMLGTVKTAGLYSGLHIETTLDPREQGFLRDHQIEGTAVLPGVMGVEAFAEAALALLPDWKVSAVENVNFLAAFKFYRNEPRTLSVETVLRPDGEDVVAECRLIGRRQIASQTEPQVTTHFTGRVRLSRTARDKNTTEIPHIGNIAEKAILPDDIYRVYFHGPAYRVLAGAWRDGDHVIGEFARQLPAECTSPATTCMTPRLIELCLQTAGVWELGTRDRFGLPDHLDALRVLRVPSAATTLYSVVTPDATGSIFDADVVDDHGNKYVEVRGYRTVAFTNPGGPELLDPFRRAMNAAMKEASLAVAH
jgi:acyl transferase domain-containing protein